MWKGLLVKMADAGVDSHLLLVLLVMDGEV